LGKLGVFGYGPTASMKVLYKYSKGEIKTFRHKSEITKVHQPNQICNL